MIFVSATDTGVGKTYFSSELLTKLKENGFKGKLAYYKPLQCGDEDGTDFDFVKKNNPDVDIFNTYFLKCPAAPNVAAEEEGAVVDIEQIKKDFEEIKSNYDFVVVEGAGGLAVPVNDDYLVSDLVKELKLPLVIVSRPDLGTINHSLLSVQHALNKNLDLQAVYISPYSNEQKKIIEIEGDNPVMPPHIKTAPRVISQFLEKMPIFTKLDTDLIMKLSCFTTQPS